jgi:hypothetical protein
VLFVYVYVGRLTILNPKNPAVLIPAVLSGFVVNPLVYVWLGLSLLGMEPSVRFPGAGGRSPATRIRSIRASAQPAAPVPPAPPPAAPQPGAPPTEAIERPKPGSEATQPLS